MTNTTDREPVAWLLTHPDEGVHTELAFMGREPITDADREAGWSAAPLYLRASPAPDDVREALVELIDYAEQCVVRLDGHDAKMMGDEPIKAAYAALTNRTAPATEGEKTDDAS
jgi:hypothetical protein